MAYFGAIFQCAGYKKGYKATIPHLVAEPVQITGDVERQDGWLILRADPATYRRAK